MILFYFKWKNYVSHKGNGTFVFINVAVVRGWEDSQSKFLVVAAFLVIVTLELDFVAANDHLNFIVFEEPFRLNFAVVKRTASHWIRLPLNQVIVGRVAPYQIANNASVVNLRKSVDFLYLLYQ